MLLGQHGRRHEHRHLLAVLDRLERGPHRHLGLAVADVAAQQPVHRPRLLHVLLDLFGRRDLVVRRLVRELGLELPLPLGVRRIRRAQPRPSRAACTSISSAAMSMTASATFAFCFSHAPEPSRDSCGCPWNPPTYF